MRIFLTFLSILFLSSLLQACTSTSTSDLSTTDTSTTRPASEKTIYKAMGNGLMGDALPALPSADQRRALEAEYRALEYGTIGQVMRWQNTNATASGEVTAGRPYRVGSQNCRQYSHNFTLATITQNAAGSACRNGDGSWSPLL